MKKLNSDDLIITTADVLPGDMVLYMMLEKEPFKPFTKENAKDNFHILIHRITIYSQNSMCTHAALAAEEKDYVYEAAIPNIRYHSPMLPASNYSLVIRRAPDNADGKKVLSYLPPISKNDSTQNPAYAYLESGIASFLCLLRRNGLGKSSTIKPALLFLELLLYPLSAAVDSLIAKKENTDSFYFCSQLTAECYNRAALEDSRFALKFTNLSNIPQTEFKTNNNKTILNWIINNADKNSVDLDQKLLSMKTAYSFDSPELLYAGLSLLCKMKPFSDDSRNKHLFEKANNSLLQNARTLHTPKLSASELSAALLSLLIKILKLYGISGSSDKEILIKFQSTFVMPVDILNEQNLVHVGEIK